MKNTYKYIAAVLLCLCMAPAAMAQFRWAAVAGANIDNMKFKQDLISIGSTAGFDAGIMGEMMFPGIGFGLDFGLLYNMMGANVDLGSRKIWSSDGFKKSNVALHMVQIPIHLRFKYTRLNGLEDIVAPLVYGGPELSIMAGHSSVKGNPGVRNPFKYSGGDLGLAVGGGAELFKRWQVTVQYTWGMTYLLKTRKLDDFSSQNRQWSFKVGYFF